MENRNRSSMPQRRKDHVRRFFGTQHKVWRNAYDAEPSEVGVYFQENIIARKAAAMKLLDDHTAGKRLKVLDIGCGPGVILPELIHRGHEIYCVDIVVEMLLECSGVLARMDGVEAGLLVSDAEELPFKSGSFDAVIALGLIEYLNSEMNGLSEIRRVLKPSGIAIISFPNLIKLQNILDPYCLIVKGYQYSSNLISRSASNRSSTNQALDDLKNRNFFQRRYRYRKMETLINKSGFAKKNMEAVGFGPFTLFGFRYLPTRITALISSMLKSLAALPPFRWLMRFANRWVVLIGPQ